MSGPDEKKLEAGLRIRNNSFYTDPISGFLERFGSVSKKLKKDTLEGIFIGILKKFQCNFNTWIRIHIRSTDPYPEQAT
jgi:hypothetical protein